MHLTEVSNAQIKQEYIFPANPGFIYTPDNQWAIHTQAAMDPSNYQLTEDL
jgi:hypothetical protein